MKDISLQLYQAFRDVLFFDEDHSYYYKDKKLISSTQIKSTVKPDVDFKYWLVYKSLEAEGKRPIPINVERGLIKCEGKVNHYTRFKVNTKPLKKQWDKASEVGLAEGSDIHNYLENAWRRKYLGKRREWLDKYVEDHRHLVPIELELIVSDLHKYAGQIDGLFYNTNTQCPELHDYKTDEEIKFENKYRNRFGGRLKKPFEHLDNCNWNEYVIQVNIYRELLSRVLELQTMYIIHFDKKTKTYTKYSVPYLDVKPLLYDN